MTQGKEYALKQAHDNNVRFIRFWFTDVLGFLKSFAITIDELEDALEEGVRFDGATLQGFVRPREEEMIALPDPATFQLLPWRPQEDGVARMFCDIYTADMQPFEGDPRYILKRTLKEAASEGYTFYTGPEIEFFFFKNSRTPEGLDTGGYFDLTPLDLASDYRRQVVLTLEQMGIDVISSHHEGSHSQHEIDLRHEDALTMADNIMTFRLITKEIGQLNGIYASFMPRPLTGQNGSGLHIHQSLFHNDTNVFYDADNPYSLSIEAQRYIAGLLRHSNEYTLITNQWINSYKRLVQGYESPGYATWSTTNPSSLIRVPQKQSSKPHSMRVELRSPDPACNPYLVFATTLAAGLKGIKEEYAPVAPVDSTDIEMKEEDKLPTEMNQALYGFRKSELMKEVLGSRVHELIIANKERELKKYHDHVTDYEISEYLPLL